MAVSLYSPNQQTKHQLEELEALLQRMLARPVNAKEEPPAATPLPTNPELFAPSPPTLPLPGRPVASGDPVVQAWRIQSPATPEATVLPLPAQQPPLATPVEQSPPAPRFFAPAVSSAHATAPVPFPYSMVFGPQTASSVVPAVPALSPVSGYGIPAPQWEAPKTSASAPPLPVALWPLLVLNKLFDLLSLPLGPLGSWLRQPTGRNTLGWLGVLMILGAIGWGLADWYGLDWTR